MPGKCVLLPYLNTGGGHRSAARAVAEALEATYGAGLDALPVDVTADYFRWPLSDLGAVYERLVSGRGRAWALTYHLTNHRRRIRILEPLWWRLTREPVLALVDRTEPDAVVCCHPLLKAPLARALRHLSKPAPLITLVTDLVSGHTTWFHPPDGPCLVPTDGARSQALRCGLAPDSVVITGLPVGSAFQRASVLDQAEARGRLGLDPDRRTVVVIAGADGMGPFHALMRALLDGRSPAQFVAITGRNGRLRERLEAATWPQPLRVMGFVDTMDEWMAAADLLVTKAGPGTIAEALVVGVPMVLCSAVPGQEPANVRYAVESGAARWAPRPEDAAEAVHDLLSDDGVLKQMSEQARTAGNPHAAQQAAAFVWGEIRGRRGSGP